MTKKRRRFSGRTMRNYVYAYIFLAPWLIGVLLLVFYPLINSFNFSLHDIRITPMGMMFIPVQLGNFHDLIVLNSSYIQNLITFTVQSLLQVPIIVSFALIIAILLNARIAARGLFRGVFFLPVIIATGPVMNELIGQGAATVPTVNVGAVAAALSFMPPMFLDPVLALFAQLIMILWNSGVQILIFLAALQKISPEQYEAAKIDGGSGWECFWKITAPTIKPMVFLNSIYTVIWLAIGGQNPVIGQIASFMHGAAHGYGYASAAAWIYSGIIMLLLGVCWLLFHDKKEKPPKEIKMLAKRNW